MQPPRDTGDPPDCSTRSTTGTRSPLLPTCNSHKPTASAANASGFLLTALSNARTALMSPHALTLRASDKALTSLDGYRRLDRRHAIVCALANFPVRIRGVR